ncbi:MAG: HEAT repeat domain-containing protein [Polyangia bacterium]|jgi:hypothetical protein
MPIRNVLVALLILLLPRLAHADKIEQLTRALMQDSSYKVRVQAALVLGHLADRRAVPVLIQALKDKNESVRGVAATSLGRLGDKSAANALLIATHDPSQFVQIEARKALELVSNSGTSSGIAMPGPRSGARFFVAVGFGAGGHGGAEYAGVVRKSLVHELAKLPTVTLSVQGAGSAPSASILSSHRLQGYIVDGTIQRLSATDAGGQQQIDCDLRVVIQTFPGRSIKAMTTEGASLQAGSGPGEEMSGKRDCLQAAVEAVGQDVGKFLSTLQ